MHADDDLAELIRAADPARTPADAGTRAHVVRDRIVAREGGAGRRRTRSLVLVAAAAAGVLAISLTTPWLGGGEGAHALTPPPLDYAPVSDSAVDVVAEATAELEDADVVVAEPVRAVDALGWYLDISYGEGDVVVAARAPERTSLVWEPDLSGRSTVIAARSTWDDDAVDAPEPGTVLSDIVFAPGEFTTPVVDPPAADAASLLAALADYGLPETYTAADLMTTAEGLLQQWTLSDTQEAVLLDLLADADDVVVEGEAADREGRPVIGLSAATPTHEVTWLVSRDTGRIVGAESALLDDLDTIPAGSIISYTLWGIES
ncbi:hypothetical protein [Microbacterium gilvum]|uniref:CU044_5270 family protein n=1 Tax=Microbacterium gilvum TaxID=1336204 RepID=A0ABP8ZT52_9MICO